MEELMSTFPIPTLVRFGLVGCVGVMIDFGVTFLLKEKLQQNKYRASAIGFCIAATSNYFLNRVWTFGSTNPDVLLQYGKFLTIATLGVGLSSLIVWLLYEKLRVNFYGAKGLSIVMIMFWNFALNSLYTFA